MRTKTKTLMEYVVPTILSGISIVLLTVVDGIFVGRGVGTDALGAVNIALPFFLLIGAVYMLITIGGITITAIRLGREDTTGANQTFMSSFIAMVVVSAIMFLLTICFPNQLARLLGANETFHSMVVDYIFWYGLFIIPSGLAVALQGFCRNDGSPVLVSVAVIACTATNIFGDWLLVFPLQMGVKGAALASGVAQVVALLVVLTHFMRKKGVLRFCKAKLEAALFKKIAFRGLPEMISQFALPITTLCLNYVLIHRVGDTAVNAFSIMNYVASFSSAIFIGTSEGLQPLFGQSYGAKNKEDLKYYFHAGLRISLVGSLVIFALTSLFGSQICTLFGADQAAYETTIAALPQFVWCFVFVSLNAIISSYLYSTKRTREAVILNIARGLIINSIVILTIPIIFGNSIIWFTAGIAEMIVLVLAVFLRKNSERGGIEFK